VLHVTAERHLCTDSPPERSAPRRSGWNRIVWGELRRGRRFGGVLRVPLLLDSQDAAPRFVFGNGHSALDTDAHALGWRGLAKEISQKTHRLLRTVYKTEPTRN